jgi:hypothetical protein
MMDFNERKRRAQKMLIDFLSVFSAPRGLDESQMANRITQIADAFARRMPTKSDYEESVQAVLRKVMDTHLSNTWPPQAAFVMAMPTRELSQFRSAETYEVKDPVERYSALMEKGEAIPESAVWGTLAGSLPHRHLDRYRNACVLEWMKIYGQDAASLMRSKYGAIVDPYFPRNGQAVGGGK